MSNLKVHAYATFEKGGPKKEHHFELATLPDDYVDVKVTHSGVCFTDVAAQDFEFGPLPLPLVGGHEVAGIVHAVGKNVTNVKVGDRVGCHNVRSACHQCPNCTRGIEQMCAKSDILAFGNGGFADYTRMQAAFVYPLPDTLPNEYAASLMCAGATMWAALTDPGIQAGHRVAILGIGGLGHLGIKFARAMGCEVGAISTSKSKEEEAKHLGAHHFIVSTDAADLKKYQDYFDFIVVTATKEIDYAPLVGMLRTPGTLVIPGIPGDSMKLSTVSLCWKGIRVFGVPGCTRKAQKQMIDFCGVHKIYPQIETLPMSQINEAFDRVKKGTPRFRVVLTP